MQTSPSCCFVRKASLEDVRTILEIERSCPTAAHWTEFRYREAIQQPDRLTLVAEEAGQIFGFLVASTATKEWELENIAVSPAKYRRGIGGALVGALIHSARQSNASEIRQEIRASNLAAQHLGQSVGFVQEGLRRNYYQAPSEDALLLKYLVINQAGR